MSSILLSNTYIDVLIEQGHILLYYTQQIKYVYFIYVK